jgi:hypothetical protein
MSMERRALIALGICLLCGQSALALNPSLDISQYAHTAWRIQDGFTKGVISSMAQTPDGYLWLGTRAGLVRFDGVRAVPWQGGQRPNVTKSPDGRIWFLPPEGVSIIDPQHLPLNPLPPPVRIEQITADGKKYDAARGLRLPPACSRPCG